MRFAFSALNGRDLARIIKILLRKDGRGVVQWKVETICTCCIEIAFGGTAAEN